MQNEGLDWNGIESLRESFKRMTSAYSKGRDFSSIFFVVERGI
jgi:hypothetical protein